MPDGTRVFYFHGKTKIDLVPTPTHLCEFRFGTTRRGVAGGVR